MAERVLVTGGAGYVGSALVPRLLDLGWDVRVLDLFLFGEGALDGVAGRSGLDVLAGDLRRAEIVRRAVDDCAAVIHLACISNDPSFDLDPALGRSINFDAFEPLVDAAVVAGVRRFVYASSSSVYGVSDATDVDEDHPLRPLTDYSRFKAMCEPILLARASERFVPVCIRPATVCGVSPRQRLDLTVNILTNHAVNRRKIRVFGGTQKRPNLHIDDMVRTYETLLEAPSDRIRGGIFNVGHANHPIAEIATIVRGVVEAAGTTPIEIETVPTDDLRSYHVSSGRIARTLGFVPRRTVEDAVKDLVQAFAAGRIPDPFGDDRYYNVERLKRLSLS
jgi:nucleoside-diphosphate-sugar epimerase